MSMFLNKTEKKSKNNTNGYLLKLQKGAEIQGKTKS